MPLLADRRRQPFGHPNEPNAPVLRRRQFAAPIGVPHPNLPSFEIDVGPFECDDLARPQPSFASEESDDVAAQVDHLRRLQAEHRQLLEQNEWLKREPTRLPVSKKIAQEIFPQKALLRLQVTDEMTELQALDLAMDLERRSHEFFEAFAKQLTDPNGRKAFLDFAKAEENHLEELRAEYAAAGRRGR